MPSDRQCCISTCPNSIAVSKVPVHKFPNPIRNSEYFNRWKTIIGKRQFEGLSDEHISKYRRVCRTHFKTEHLCRFNRLAANAVPTINISAAPEPNNTNSPQDEVKQPTADCEIEPAVNTIIDANVFTDIAVEEIISEYGVVSAFSTLNDDDIYTDIAAEEVICDSKDEPEGNDTISPKDEVEKPTADCEVYTIIDVDVCSDIAAEEVTSDNEGAAAISSTVGADIYTDVGAEEVISDNEDKHSIIGCSVDEPEGNNTISPKDEVEKPTADCEVYTIVDVDVCSDTAAEEVTSDYEGAAAISSTVDADMYTDVGAEEVISDHEDKHSIIGCSLVGYNDCDEKVIDSGNLYDYFEKLLKIPSANKPPLPADEQRIFNGFDDCHKTIIKSEEPNDCFKEYVEIPTRPTPFVPATEQRRINESNDCIETITESEEPFVCIQEVLNIPSSLKPSLLANEQRKNNESNDCHETITESEKPYDCIKEVLNISSTTKPSLLPNEQRKDNERILPILAMHSHITCDNCKKPIVGFHYKCLSCVNYNHCHKCEMQEAHPNHYMIRIPKLPEVKVPENIIDDYCDTFKAIINSGADPKMCKSILRANKSVNSNSKACNSVHYLTEEVKLSLRKKVSRVVKENAVVAGKRKIQMRQYTVNKKKMTVPPIDNEPQTLLEMGHKENYSSLVLINNNNSRMVHSKGFNNESMFTIATVTDPDFIDVNHRTNNIVSDLLIETTNESEKIYSYVDS